MDTVISSAATVVNLRDLAVASPGRVRPGVAVRSGQLDKLDVNADPAFESLAPDRIIDLRTKAERSGAPDVVPDGATLIVADVLADSPDSDPAKLAPMFADVEKAKKVLGGGGAMKAFLRIYQEVVTLESARSSYRKLLLELADEEAEGDTVLFHCTAGKDRTGWGAAVLLTIAGASHDEIVTDYLASDENTRAYFAPLVEKFVAEGGDADAVRDVIGVREEYLAESFKTLNAEFGDFDTYLRDGLSINTDQVSRVRSRLTGS